MPSQFITGARLETSSIKVLHMTELEKLNKAIQKERQQYGLTGRLEDLITKRNKLLKGK